MINDIVKDADQRMAKSVESLVEQFKRIRTGRATPAILDSVKVNYYGSEMADRFSAGLAGSWGFADCRCQRQSPHPLRLAGNAARFSGD